MGNQNKIHLLILFIILTLLIAACENQTTNHSKDGETTEPNTIGVATVSKITAENIKTDVPVQSPTITKSSTKEYFFSALSVFDANSLKEKVGHLPQPGNKFVGIKVVLANISGFKIKSFQLNGKLITSDGNVYESVGSGSGDGDLPMAYIIPGEKLVGSFIFDIPTNSVLEKLIYDADDIVLESNLDTIQDTTIPGFRPQGCNVHLPYITSNALDIKVVTIADPVNDTHLGSPENTRFVAYEITVTASKMNGNAVSSMDFFLVDSEGNVYEPEIVYRGIYINKQFKKIFELITLEPEQSANGWILFSIPSNIKPAYIQDDMASSFASVCGN